MEYDYYYNNVPGVGLTRNNLIYTSLISKDKKTFVQWYHNDTEYHFGKNQVVDPEKMTEKWQREKHFLCNMEYRHPDLVPQILDINVPERKIYLRIDGPDFWNCSNCDINNYNSVVPDWQDQMLDIIRAHKLRGWHKYSMHPSSYFVVDGRLKSINYFFTYHYEEPNICLNDVSSHIHENRQNEIRKYVNDWDKKFTWSEFDKLCWNSFRNNYPIDFIEKVLNELQIS